jgi:MOSC domain-containing protein YiiM
VKLVSLNVGTPRTVAWNGREVSTGIYKSPVEKPVMLRTLNLDGDRQADLTVHGGAAKAVYAYPSEHYPFWRSEFPQMELPYGMFGENFTTSGFFEDEVKIGDTFEIGDAEIMVTQPRMPCYKLGIKFGRTDILKRFLASGLTGFYFSVLRAGLVTTDDTFGLLRSKPNSVTVADVTNLYASGNTDRKILDRAMAVEELPESWRDYFRRRFELD